jgi:iron complex transport system permease protein
VKPLRPLDRLLLPFAIFFLVLTALWALTVGQFPISVGDIVKLLGHKLLGGSDDVAENAHVVLFELRAPRVAVAFIVGAALSAAGAAYQNLFRNPLVSPDILGVSGGAALGAVLGILFGSPWLLTQGFAFAGGLIAVTFIFAISHRLRAQDPVLTLALTGVVLGAALGAVIALVKYLADPYRELPAITYWLLGSFASVTPRDAVITAVIAGAAIVPIFLLRWRINLLGLPDDEARTLGLDVRRTRAIVVIAATLMTAASVAVCGIIGWVGLVIPHAVRLIVGGEFSRLLPLSMVIGGTFLLLVDTLARSIIATEVPPGVLTAMIGAPAFIALMAATLRRRA